MNKLTARGYCAREDTFCNTHCSALSASMLHFTAHDLFSRQFPSGSCSHSLVLGGVKCLDLLLTSAEAEQMTSDMGPMVLLGHCPSCSNDVWALAGDGLNFVPASKCWCSLLRAANTSVSQLLSSANVINLCLQQIISICVSH